MRESMNLMLDSEGLPVAQAGGQKNKQDDNSGDIIIEYKDRTLLLEVTLMDKNAIKRGEWEPVLRHTVNLSASRTVPVQTYLITDAVDKNTENIWRSVSATDLEETAVQHRSVRATIYSLTIDTLIKWLHDKSVNEEVIWDAVATSYKALIETDFDANWKTDILASISSNN
ncbi:AlwI family type II restriction endonuclease [Pediococcus pentosaceus]|uniref:AlwI family type II restriction endonuclease n=1 Tax=Pediococcus pentosaceus TaxID=1255 RepID=UPI00338D68C8